MTTVRVEETSPGIRLITLDRPDKLNAMNAELVADLHEVFASLAGDETIRAAVLTGEGRGFCAGLDLSEGATPRGFEDRGSLGRGWATQESISSLIPRMRNLAFPIVAAVNGPASGGGLGLALGSDIRLAASSARFNVAFVRIGLSGCDIGVSWLLPRLVGASRAWELMLTGRLIDAAEADRIGLVVRVVPDGKVVEAALDTADLIAGNSPFGVRMTKQVAWSQLEVGSLQAAIDIENRTQVMTSSSGDLREAMAAFLEKRPPEFTGE